MMLHLLLLPFRLIGGILHTLFGIIGGILGLIGGIIGTVFGLLGGIVGLALHLSAIGLIIGLIVAVFKKRKTKDTYFVDGEEFTSFYNRR